MEENKTHRITMDNRESLTVTGVEDVESFDEERVVVITNMGTMTVIGDDFRISKLNVDDGQLVIDGKIDELQYSDTLRNDKDGGFFRRLFK